MSEWTYREAVIEALADELAGDEDVILLGEDIGAAGGVFKATEGLQSRFGVDRVRDTPISEQAIVGAAIGSALCGMRPVAEIMFADFAGVCYDQIANQLAKYHYMSGGQGKTPVTIRFGNGGGLGFAAQHSQTVENWFLPHPGLKIVVPSTADDAYALLRASIRDDAPVLFFEQKALYAKKFPREGGGEAEIGKARVVREGADVTVVATQLMLHRALEAAERLDGEVDVEVVDPRSLVPFDLATVVASLEKTARLVVVQEGPAAGSWGAGLVTDVVGSAFDLLDAAPVLISAPATPVPYAESLELSRLPDADRVEAEIKKLLL
jgi:acetoin:2,6-dichlorophenolindophenol oxidoreductase subunit beta